MGALPIGVMDVAGRRMPTTHRCAPAVLAGRAMVDVSTGFPANIMLGTLDVLGSTLTSGLRGWRGTRVVGAERQPARLLELYEFEACPECRLVREALTELDLDARVFPVPVGGKRFRGRLPKPGRRTRVPCLVDPNTGRTLNDPAAILTHLYRHYGGRDVPLRQLRAIDVATSTLASLSRLAAGARARPSRPARRPLELFSFESSPYSRRVRERLSELELAYVLRNTGKDRWQDLGPPVLRRLLFPRLPVTGRNREALLERAGRVQLPWLYDPNTDTGLFESGAICEYLERTYGRPSPGAARRPLPQSRER